MSIELPSLTDLKENFFRSEHIYKRGLQLLRNDLCTETTTKGDLFRFTVEDRFDDFTVAIDLSGNQVKTSCNCRFLNPCCSHVAAALLALHDRFSQASEAEWGEHNVYKREEMITRVLRERQERAAKEEFKLEIGDTVYGSHKISTAGGKTYEIMIRDFTTNSGYCNCPDFKTSKLGTCKHLIFASRKLQQELPAKKLRGREPYPFVEIFCDPLNDYHITSFHKGRLSRAVSTLLAEYFPTDNSYVLPPHYPHFTSFLQRAEDFKKINIRPEVRQKVERYFEDAQLNKLAASVKINFDTIKAKLFPYQKDGITFALCKKGCIIADEMGLGKTIQAIGAALLKRELFDFKKVIIICPASLKHQWQQEIEKFSTEHPVVVEGDRAERTAIYKRSQAYFLITNYEAVLRDITIIQKNPPDMVILDEAQRIKNYNTKTSHAVKSIPRRHSLVITGTPIENRLIDLYSVMNFIDPHFLAPLWEFSMQHCYFDKSKKNKITGYFNLQSLKERLSQVIIRRQKKDVLKQLPKVQEITVPIQLSMEQLEMHAGFARSLSMYMAKKHKTFYDMQRIFQLLTCMRMVCDSTYLIDKETNISPKLKELEEILLEKLDIVAQQRKIIIFSEWKSMLHLIEKFLIAKHIGHITLSGEVPVKNRGKLIDEFASNPDCLVFLSTEAGGAGLNLQMADTVINFELPWNPAKKNQRIGRIHRIGQKSQKLTVINLVSSGTIEERIASGIVLKESLFDAVLNEAVLTDEVDFSAKGRATMIEEIEKMVSPLMVERADEERQELEEELAAGSDDQQSAVSRFMESREKGVDDLDQHVSAAAAETEGIQSQETSLQEIVADTGDGELEAVNVATHDADEAGRAPQVAPPAPTTEAMEKTLNQGIGFLSSIMEMATGKKLLTDEQSVTVDKKTGEVTMKFKLPGF